MKVDIRANGIQLIPESNLDNDLLHAWDQKTVVFSEAHTVNPLPENCGFQMSGRPFLINLFIGFKRKE